jgi:hypothetical protein
MTQIEKALEWMKNHPEKGSSLYYRAECAAWRFNVDTQDLLYALEQGKKNRSE